MGRRIAVRLVLLAAAVCALVALALEVWPREKPNTEDALGGFLCKFLQSPTLCDQITWLQVVAWLAGTAGVIIGLVALYQRVFQARASFLLGLDETWAKIVKQRLDVQGELGVIKKNAFSKHSDYADKVRLERVQELCEEFLSGLRDSERDCDRIRYREMLEYLGFFETVGLMVKRGYVPLRDMVQMYKGPILDLETFFRKHINKIQTEANVPSGMYENAFYLVKWTRRYECRWLVRWL